MIRKIVAGNWKMNGLRRELDEIRAIQAPCPTAHCEVVICPPATLLQPMVRVCTATNIKVGAQDCHENTSGAHTGDISALMLADAGASHVILGHSERRATYGETDSQVRAKSQAAWNAGLTAIICIGETLDHREAGSTLEIAARQLAGSVPGGATSENTVIAYEPIWAIGTGKTPTLEQISEVHGFIREKLQNRFAAQGPEIRILYGGSMNSKNCADIATVTNVDGGLVGGASLKASDFSPIVHAFST